MFSTNWQRAHVWKGKNARRHATNVMPFSEIRSTGKIGVEGEDMSCYTHQTLFQQQLYNPDLKPLLYMPALSEPFQKLSILLYVGFHGSQSLFSINSCPTPHSNVPPVNQSTAATKRNQDKNPLVITAKAKRNYLHIYPSQIASLHGRQGVWSVFQNVFRLVLVLPSVISLHHQYTLSFLNYICIKYQAPT